MARPLRVLVPLIKEDLEEMQTAVEAATFEFRIKIGKKLLEAKSQLSVFEWRTWLQKNFHLSQGTAAVWMRAVQKTSRGESFRTMSHAAGDHRKSHESPWSEDVKDYARKARSKMATFGDTNGSGEEDSAIRDLCNRIIDIGYRVLSVELHPDKKGGSEMAMRHLNAARARMREAV